MNISDENREEIEAKLRQMAELDPAQLPEPAAELAELLGAILDQVEAS